MNDVCVGDRCTPRCPAGCHTDNDCALCGAPGSAAHACHGGICAECSTTYACPAGKMCNEVGACVVKCGQDGDGSCHEDADCEPCLDGAQQCHKPLNDVGKCGPGAAGCSDFGQGVVVLPLPWNQVTNLCSHDNDCAGIGIQLNVGKLLRDLTGIDDIDDANLDYGMDVCTAVSVGSGTLSCGVCVPCRVDADCHPIDVDQLADEIFGQNDHNLHMYCQNVAGDYGVCAPCPGIVYECAGTPSSGGNCAPTCAPRAIRSTRTVTRASPRCAPSTATAVAPLGTASASARSLPTAARAAEATLSA